MSTTVPDRLPIAGATRWQLLRAGIQNVWEYDDQRFIFHRGRLMLRGENESGKSKALEVLLPFLLDASLHPQRLDPFGSTARSMRWNLINDSNPTVTVSIGYVWLELGRQGGDGPEYWTIGAGLKARRTGPQVDDWYFATSRRVDEDLKLVDANRTPLTRPHLTAALGGEGTVFESGAHYRRALNEKLFGLGADQYSALVDALLQLRRPQLSKGLDPDELSRILSASMPPLDAQVIGSLAEGFERLDRHRDEREECRSTLISVRAFLDVYRQYAAAIAKGRALEVTRADSAFHAARAKQKEAEGKRDAAVAALASIDGRIEETEGASLALEERLRVLRESDAYRAVSELENAERQAHLWKTSSERSRGARSDGEARAARKQEHLAEAEALAAKDAGELETESRTAEAGAKACDLAEAHGAMILALEQGRGASAEDTLRAALRIREEAIDALRKLVRRHEEATRILDAATVRATAAEQRSRDADDAVRRAANSESLARAELVEAIEAWAAACLELAVALPALLDLPPEQMRGAATAAASGARASLDEALARASLEHDTAALHLKEARAERDALATQRHQPPTAPVWRAPRASTRPGAPLYLVCDFAEHVDADARAGLEAALEAAGLLDAWLTPDGAVLDPETFDSMLVAQPVDDGPTLTSVLRPVHGAAVTVERVRAVLASVGLGESNARAWVSTDGQFAIGPLRGSYQKQSAAFIGAAARERARIEKLAELSTRVAQLETAVAERASAVEAVRERRARLDQELASFPDVQALRDAQADLRARASELDAARATHAEELERVRHAEGARAQVAQTLSERAGKEGLRAWIDRLDDLVTRTAAWQAEALTLLRTFDRVRRSRAEVDVRKAELRDLLGEVERLKQAALDEHRQALEAQARVDALNETVGKTRDDLLSNVREAEGHQSQIRKQLKDYREQQTLLQAERATLVAASAASEVKVTEADTARREAERHFRTAEERGLLAVIGAEGPGAAHAWSYTDVLLTARKVDDATAKTDASDAGRDKAWNRVSERHQELMRSLKPELKVLASQLDGVTVYEATLNARRLSLLQLDAELENDLHERDRLLADEERKLFESFLTGEAHEHLREQLREAIGLVKRMNRQLEAHPTSSGMKMRLQWEVAEDAAPGTRQAVALLFKSGELMSDADRTALLGFLRQRLDEARAGGEVGHSLQEQLLSVLDYRRWHTFEVQCRAGSEPWKRLTRKVHAAGSGGQKAVMLHLPLFAAAAAFYDSARTGAPRFILLDEAFAGIDRKTRGELMGLLADFDLDFVMTSFEEWGFYPQLDGLSTYHLAREKGMRGVYSDWFVWNGLEPVQMQT
ncbi:MAG: TIGR02680 family protein [Deltaproteobacteria bacterium]|nr:TIGR02680 family protein [Deltaproteobacteria bacterium]